MKDKIKLALLGLELSNSFDNVPNYNALTKDDFTEISCTDKNVIYYVCNKYFGYSICDMEHEVIKLTKEYFKWYEK